MATPRVFVSSTWYDLRYIRENIKYFVKTLGYEPILSEEGSIFYDPKIHVQDACISEIPNCQIFILIVGGRYGSAFKETQQSVTNAEYLEAVRLKIPVFALIEQSVLNDFHLYCANRQNKLVDASKITYPSADSTKIFEFIEMVRGNAVNNSLVPFRDFSDIESYLRQQWAGMMFSFLLGQNENARVADTLTMLKSVSERVEMLSRQILESVGTKTAKLTALLYDRMLQHECIRDMAYMGGRPTPEAILASDTFDDCFVAGGGTLNIENGWDGSTVGKDGSISPERLEDDREGFRELRSDLIRALEEQHYTVSDYLADIKSTEA
jgi:uncharacterized protein DUF4062